MGVYFWVIQMYHLTAIPASYESMKPEPVKGGSCMPKRLLFKHVTGERLLLYRCL
jgi:hypothetical protein